MKIIIHKCYLDIAESYEIPAKQIKTHEGVVNVAENEKHELILDINDNWFIDIIHAYAKTVKKLVNMYNDLGEVFELLGLRAESITRAHHEMAINTKSRDKA